jgi:hypothetical protein
MPIPLAAAAKLASVDVCATYAACRIFMADLRRDPARASSLDAPIASPLSHWLFRSTRVAKRSVRERMACNVFSERIPELKLFGSLQAAANVETGGA